MTRHLERRILLLQILLGMVCCTSLSFLSLLLSRFGFNNLQIGLVMMAAACSTSIAKPCWGMFTDRVPCTRRILVVTLALGIASFTLLGKIPVIRYVCLDCGYVENWVETAEQREALHRAFG